MSETGINRSTVIQGGIIVLIIISIGFSGYMINQAVELAQQAKARSEEVDKKISNFIEVWKKRIQISNNVNNMTQEKLNDTLIELKNATASREIESNQVERNVLNNLTGHRIITNATHDHVVALINDTNRLIQGFNQTNEVERAKAVNSILDGISNNTEVLKQITKALNITEVTEEPENEEVQTDLQELLENIIKDKNLTNNTS